MRCSCRVTPASSPVLAWRLWLRRLISVDLPTFGTPQISTRMGLAMPPRWGASRWQSAISWRTGAGPPQRGALGVGQILLVKHLEPGFVAGKLGQQRIGAGAWQARVQHLDHG